MVADAIAEDGVACLLEAGVANRLADHENEFGLVIELVGDFGELDRPVGIGDARRLLREPKLLLRQLHVRLGRSEERRVGKECVSTCRYRGSTKHVIKKKSI